MSHYGKYFLVFFLFFLGEYLFNRFLDFHYDNSVLESGSIRYHRVLCLPHATVMSLYILIADHVISQDRTEEIIHIH